jgi:hypothetical protein
MPVREVSTGPVMRESSNPNSSPTPLLSTACPARKHRGRIGRWPKSSKSVHDTPQSTFFNWRLTLEQPVRVVRQLQQFDSVLGVAAVGGTGALGRCA